MALPNPRRLLEPVPDYATMRSQFAWDIPERFNMGTACSTPDDSSIALRVVEDDTNLDYTFEQLGDASSRLAAALVGLGVRQGDRVAVVAPQSWETGVSHLGIWKAGAISVPLASLFGPDALRYRLNDSGARLAIVSPDNIGKVVEADPDLDIISTDDEFDDFIAVDPIESAQTKAEDPAYLIYTSGTTGPPKGALLPHRSLIGHLTGFDCYYEFPSRDDIIWTPADWAWIGGLMDVLVPAWYYGMSVVTTNADFDPARAIRLMVEQKVTLAFLPPTALKMMRASDVGSEHLSLRAIFTGGEPLGAELLEWSRSHLGCHINEGYGQTEANLVVGNCNSVWPTRPGSMGKPLPGHDVAVFSDTGERVIGEVGEICVRTPDPVTMLRYWNRSDSDKYRGSWLLTGDLGVEDEDGYLWFSSRKDDVIMSMGYRIGPGEIEESLLGHPSVSMAAVVGVPDELRGQVPKAFVVLRDGHNPSAELTEELQGHVRTRLAAHEVPRTIDYVHSLPRTTTGKIMRRALREPDQ
ncbi:MAG: AMP-binding protein [Acidimicrobiia bacterium]|nr:AMP-binding protein [Acidimicrobiia bacterium]